MTINNEKGYIVYVLMISMVLMIFIPGLLMMSSTFHLDDQRNESEMKATQLAVSGMQAFLKYPDTDVVKLMDYLKRDNYGLRTITLPEGGIIHYRQYVVPAGTSDNDAINSANAVASTSIVENGNYRVVITARTGDTNNNEVKDAGEYSYALRSAIRNWDLSTQISSQYPTSHRPGAYQLVALRITTVGKADGTPVSVELVTDVGDSLSPQIIHSNTISSNAALLSLKVPSNVAAETYMFKVTTGVEAHITTEYKISSTAPVSSAFYFDENGTVQTRTKDQLAANGSISTSGVFFIPQGYSTLTLNNGQAVNYSAARGVFVGSSITTQGNPGTFMIKACNGPIELVHSPTLTTSNKNKDITLFAQQYITVIGSTMYGNRVKLTANTLTADQNINVSSATITVVKSGNIDPSIAFSAKTIAQIIDTGLVTNGATPSKVTNGGTAACP
jgi:hypothetical protein